MYVQSYSNGLSTDYFFKYETTQYPHVGINMDHFMEQLSVVLFHKMIHINSHVRVQGRSIL